MPCLRTQLSLSSLTYVSSPSRFKPRLTPRKPHQQLHQITPPILTCLLTSALPVTNSSSRLIPQNIRSSAASLLDLLLTRHSDSYPSLRPRITKTLLRGLGGDNRGLGARWGAAHGLSGIVGGKGGNKAVREWIGGGLKALGEMIEKEEEGEEGERDDLANEVLVRSFCFSVFQDRLPRFS